ncbi:MAG: hypothetical protein Q8Q09_05000 [Deltaproteobacteria bacterium]|nr:hypothetical protein [Deltaproteobacteria bacterium]
MADPTPETLGQLQAMQVRATRCSDDTFNLDHEVFDTVTQRPVDDIAQVTAQTDSVRRAFSQHFQDGSADIGPCCQAAASAHGPMCVRVSVRAGSANLAQIAAHFAGVAASLPVSLRLSVTLTQPSGARCTADDPDCGPVSYRHGCPDSLGYRRGGVRVPVSNVVNAPHPLAGYEGGVCQRDGECLVGGCGNHCVAAGSQSFTATCEAVPAFDEALCGCVQGACRWFVQPQ